MITIYKYEIPIAGSFNISMPTSAQILTCQLQNGSSPVLWASVNTEEILEERKFILIGTGNPFPEKFNLNYVGTFQMGGFVGHLFEEIE